MDYKIILKEFEGPLDLLLNLISKAKIDIYDIPIHIITKQYMEYIYSRKKLNLEIASEFLVMASTLLEIKSKMLLPKEKVILEGEEYEIDPREELVNRILEYRKYKEASNQLKEFEKEKSKTYYKPQEDLSIYEDKTIDFNNFDLELLVGSLNNILIRRGIIQEEVDIELISREEYTLTECAGLILRKLEKSDKINFEDLLEDDSQKSEIITYFLSLLELIKTKSVMVRQESSFSELIIEKVVLEES